MGSFNTTCAISHAPIRDGDKVRLFFLASESYMHDSEGFTRHSISNGCQCYSCDDFKVIGGVALEATYADYNQYEFDEDSLAAKLILKTITENYAENLPEEGVRYNESHDHMNVSVDSLDWEKVQDMIHSGRLFLKGYTQKLSFVAFMAVHENVFHVMKQDSWKRYDRDKQDYVTHTIESLIQKELSKNDPEVRKARLQPHIDRIIDLFQERLNNCSTEEQRQDIMNRVEDLAEMFMNDHDVESSRGGIRDYYYQTRDVCRDALALQKENDLSIDSFNEFVRLAMEVEGFNLGMVMFNYMYRPIMTSGQEHDFPAHANFLRSIADAVEATKSRWQDERIETTFHKEYWQELNLSDIENQFSEWYGDEQKVNEVLAPLKAAIEGLDFLIVETSELYYRNDPYGLCDAIENKAVPLRIYNK